MNIQLQSIELSLAIGLTTTINIGINSVVNAEEIDKLPAHTSLLAQTEKDYADQVTADVNNCSTQRVLSEIGWQQAKTIGTAFAQYSIPFDEVISSQYCRAWQTADLAFGKYEKNPALNFLPFEDYTDEQVEQMKANVTPLLTAVPATGTNTVIVGHDDIFESATGIYPDPQGMAYVVKPDGNGSFELIANMMPEDWAQIGSN